MLCSTLHTTSYVCTHTHARTHTCTHTAWSQSPAAAGRCGDDASHVDGGHSPCGLSSGGWGQRGRSLCSGRTVFPLRLQLRLHLWVSLVIILSPSLVPRHSSERGNRKPRDEANTNVQAVLKQWDSFNILTVGFPLLTCRAITWVINSEIHPLKVRGMRTLSHTFQHFWLHVLVLQVNTERMRLSAHSYLSGVQWDSLVPRPPQTFNRGFGFERG